MTLIYVYLFQYFSFILCIHIEKYCRTLLFFFQLKQVIDLKAIAEMKEKDSIHLAKDPLDDVSVCAKFVSEVEKYEKLVDGLVRKSLNGTTPLDQKWKVTVFIFYLCVNVCTKV